ncbi:2-polyprenylphenol hydroxylase, partial [Gammaproteobacteria bacterium]|nr:2-polyprenylphenol hydroxylase [Gammaproteobacteria bacterium]
SELPSIVYETLDELRGLAKHKSANEIKIRKMEIQIQKEKFMIRACVIVIIFIIALAMYSK